MIIFVKFNNFRILKSKMYDPRSNIYKSVTRIDFVFVLFCSVKHNVPNFRTVNRIKNMVTVKIFQNSLIKIASENNINLEKCWKTVNNCKNYNRMKVYKCLITS